VYPFILTLLTTVLLIPAIFAAPESGLGHFYHSAWFWIPGGILFIASLKAAVAAVVRHRWSSLVSHLGVALLFIGLLRETKSRDGVIEVREGETARTCLVGKAMSNSEFGMTNTELLGFEVTLTGFQEDGFVSRVRFNQGPELRIAPSHPRSFQGWLILQESFDQDTARGWLRLLTEQGDTLRAVIGEPLEASLLGSQGEKSQTRLVFDRGGVQTRDTLFRFRLFENDVEKLTGFVSRRGVIPPSLKLGLKLLDSEVGGRYISFLRAVKRPGAGLVFLAFIVLLAGILMLAVESHEPQAQTKNSRGDTPPKQGGVTSSEELV
jgi:hypothetical protein